MRRFVVPCALAIGMALLVTACTDPHDPPQRAGGPGAATTPQPHPPPPSNPY
jgi:hypothetical protein